MSAPSLPKPRDYPIAGNGPECPWCYAELDDMRVALSDINVYHDVGVTPAETRVTITGDCPECGRPLTIREWQHHSMRLGYLEVYGHTEPELTSGDRAYLASLANAPEDGQP